MRRGHYCAACRPRLVLWGGTVSAARLSNTLPQDHYLTSPPSQKVPHGHGTTAEHYDAWHPHRPICRGGRCSHSRAHRAGAVLLTYDDEHHRIALGVVLEQLHGDVVLERPQGREVGQIMRRVALIDPKPLTRRWIGELLAQAFPECAMGVASTCEELLEIDESRIGRPDLVLVYIRSAGLTRTLGYKARLSCCGCGSRRPRPLCFLTGTMWTKSTAL
jgi:hypothetical protein